jgi:hypothetical protein
MNVYPFEPTPHDEKSIGHSFDVTCDVYKCLSGCSTQCNKSHSHIRGMAVGDIDFTGTVISILGEQLCMNTDVLFVGPKIFEFNRNGRCMATDSDIYKCAIRMRRIVGSVNPSTEQLSHLRMCVIFNTNDNHWVTATFNGIRCVIYDSMRTNPIGNIKATMSKLTISVNAMYKSDDLRILFQTVMQHMNVVIQSNNVTVIELNWQTDVHSCGPLSLLSLYRFATGASVIDTNQSIVKNTISIRNELARSLSIGCNNVTPCGIHGAFSNKHLVRHTGMCEAAIRSCVKYKLTVPFKNIYAYHIPELGVDDDTISRFNMIGVDISDIVNYKRASIGYDVIIFDADRMECYKPIGVDRQWNSVNWFPLVVLMLKDGNRRLISWPIFKYQYIVVHGIDTRVNMKKSVDNLRARRKLADVRPTINHTH